jgi:hypothetical protein
MVVLVVLRQAEVGLLTVCVEGHVSLLSGR